LIYFEVTVYYITVVFETQYIATEGRPTRCHCLLNMLFEASDTRDLIYMVTFTFTMRYHLIWLASALFTSSRLETFGWVRFPCATREKYNAEFTKGG